MARYRPIDFMGKKDDEPAMAEKLAREDRANAGANALHSIREIGVCDFTTSRRSLSLVGFSDKDLTAGKCDMEVLLG